MRKYDREKYTLKAYKDEKYMLEIVDDNTMTGKTLYSNNWENLYAKAKKEISEGKQCAIWSLCYEFTY